MGKTNENALFSDAKNTYVTAGFLLQFHCKMFGIRISPIYKTIVHKSIKGPVLKLLNMILIDLMVNGNWCMETTAKTSG